MKKVIILFMLLFSSQSIFCSEEIAIILASENFDFSTIENFDEDFEEINQAKNNLKVQRNLAIFGLQCYTDFETTIVDSQCLNTPKITNLYPTKIIFNDISTSSIVKIHHQLNNTFSTNEYDPVPWFIVWKLVNNKLNIFNIKTIVSIFNGECFRLVPETLISQ